MVYFNFRIFILFIVGVMVFSSTNAQQLTLKDITCDSVVTFIAGDYKREKKGRFLLGNHYRREWGTPVKARMFSLQKTGMVVTKQGGSRQTVNLHLRDSLGREYVLRSINKNTSRAISNEFHQTFVADIIQDQTSADHPYGAFTIPPMAHSIGIYHTNPILVFVPRDPAFGEYADALANQPALFELRPDGDLSAFPNMGNAKDAKSTEKMFQELYKDNDVKVDEIMYARCRLFDMLIGDWGRHEDQWRWGRFEENGSIIYRPIPRDHDHAYFLMDGLLPSIAVNTYGVRNMSGFETYYKSIIGLTTSAASLDRKLLTSVTRDEFIQQATYIQEHLPDSIIDYALSSLPEEVYHSSADKISKKLKSRRDKLHQLAEIYYEVLAKEVNVTGSDKAEYFLIDLADKSVSIKIYKLTKNQELGPLIYERTFLEKETDELNIYGMGRSDSFEVKGKLPKGMKISLIGGEGMDVFSMQNELREGGKKIRVYDDKDNPINDPNAVKDLRSSNRKDSANVFFSKYQYNYTGPFLYLGFNPDDGVFIGPGIIKRTYEYRKQPMAIRQSLGFKYAFSTSAFTVSYKGDYKLVLQRWHFLLEAMYMGPQFVFNYFGYGNESENIQDIDFYRVRGNRICFNPSFYKELSSTVKLGLGPQYDYYDIERTAERIVATSDPKLEPAIFEGNHFAGLKGYLKILDVDSLFYPRRGYGLHLSVTPYAQVGGDKHYVNASGNLSFFHSFKGLDWMTFALRVGGAVNFGDYFFFQAPYLSGTDNLRGYRRSRFFGDQSAFSNNEIRLRVLKFKNYLFSSTIGLIGFYDIGRVWADNENSNSWHSGYGPGIYLTLFERIIFSGTFGFSEDGTNVNIQYGLFF